MNHKPKRNLIAEAIEPNKKIKEYGTWHDDGMKIVAFITANKSEHQQAIAYLYKDCPHKHSMCVKTGKHIPVTAHTVAAWAANPDNHTGVVARMKAKDLI